MITRNITHFFPCTLWALSVSTFNFCISRPSKFSSMGSLSPLHYVLVCKIHIYMPKMTLSSLLTQASFFYKKFANFRYITCFVLNLILIWSRFHGQSTLKKVLEYYLPSTTYLILAPSLAPFNCLFFNWWSSSCKFSIIGLISSLKFPSLYKFHSILSVLKL